MVFPNFDLTGQVALVTGAARGSGNTISLALAHAGADIALGLRDNRILRSCIDTGFTTTVSSQLRS
jgi:NAD(P)-dependent dehydrogenase (short-subunit alcohol dehydrogenase family)